MGNKKQSASAISLVSLKGGKRRQTAATRLSNILAVSSFLAILGTQWANFFESPKLSWRVLCMVSKHTPNGQEMLGNGQLPIFLNGGGDSADESLCPDSFSLDIPLHVWHLFAIIQQFQNNVNLGYREALVTEGCLCVCLYFFKNFSSPWECGYEKSCVCHYGNLGWGAKTRTFFGASTADTVWDREWVFLQKCLGDPHQEKCTS